MKQSRSDDELHSQPAAGPGLDRADFDALYDRWFPRAIGWLHRKGCAGREAELVVRVALETFLGEVASGASRDENRMAQRLLTRLRHAHSLLAQRPIQSDTRVSPLTDSIAATADQ